MWWAVLGQVACLDEKPHPSEPLTGRLAGLVLTEVGEPLTDAVVMVAGLAAITDEEGTFEIANVPIGTYTVEIGGDDAMSGSWPVTIIERLTTPLVAALLPRVASQRLDPGLGGTVASGAVEVVFPAGVSFVDEDGDAVGGPIDVVIAAPELGEVSPLILPGPPMVNGGPYAHPLEMFAAISVLASAAGQRVDLGADETVVLRFALPGLEEEVLSVWTFGASSAGAEPAGEACAVDFDGTFEVDVSHLGWFGAAPEDVQQQTYDAGCLDGQAVRAADRCVLGQAWVRTFNDVFTQMSDGTWSAYSAEAWTDDDGVYTTELHASGLALDADVRVDEIVYTANGMWGVSPGFLPDDVDFREISTATYDEYADCLDRGAVPFEVADADLDWAATVPTVPAPPEPTAPPATEVPPPSIDAVSVTCDDLASLATLSMEATSGSDRGLVFLMETDNYPPWSEEHDTALEPGSNGDPNDLSWTYARELRASSYPAGPFDGYDRNRSTLFSCGHFNDPYTMTYAFAAVDELFHVTTCLIAGGDPEGLRDGVYDALMINPPSFDLSLCDVGVLGAPIP
jgi:hypothetical protein